MAGFISNYIEKLSLKRSVALLQRAGQDKERKLIDIEQQVQQEGGTGSFKVNNKSRTRAS
ncbi:hypothetical protein FHR92_000214 [Fontibacillus solani]|uniref:Uncharacterized protein n=1 Tax=Fontibacillus solani TaxID=1572857 RepID=A0A7W3SPF5_9BACL|nr:hypothetical protein [Fontibacillus solani]MBA9083771.1 hypothetical protein [Fontibacillus solani]